MAAVTRWLFVLDVQPADLRGALEVPQVELVADVDGRVTITMR